MHKQDSIHTACTPCMYACMSASRLVPMAIFTEDVLSVRNESYSSELQRTSVPAEDMQATLCKRLSTATTAVRIEYRVAHAAAGVPQIDPQSGPRQRQGGGARAVHYITHHLLPPSHHHLPAPRHACAHRPMRRPHVPSRTKPALTKAHTRTHARTPAVRTTMTTRPF